MNHLRLIFMLSFMSVTVNSFNEKAISRVKTIASENHCYIKFIKGFCILSSTKNLCIRVWPWLLGGSLEGKDIYLSAWQCHLGAIQGQCQFFRGSRVLLNYLSRCRRLQSYVRRNKVEAAQLKLRAPLFGLALPCFRWCSLALRN